MIIWGLEKLRSKKREYIEFTGEWLEAFGRPEKRGFWIIYGKSGMGKTRFSLLLARELERLGYKVLYLSMEMEDSDDFVNELESVDIYEENSNIMISPGDTKDELDGYLSKQRSADVIIFDTIQYFEEQFGGTASELIELRKKFKKKLFIAISHVDGKEVDGKLAYKIKRDSFRRIMVEGFRAIFKGRGKGGTKGYYTIWEEGSKEYWVENQ